MLFIVYVSNTSGWKTLNKLKKNLSSRMYNLKVSRAGPFCGFAGLADSAANISEVSQSVSYTLPICV